MATYQAIAAIGEAILGLLEAARPKPEFANAQFALYQSTNFQNPMEEGISLYLYRVATNTTRRNLPPHIGPDGRRYRPPLPLDLHYLLTPWARTAAKQQRLLGWSMRALEDTPILPAGLLNHYGTEPETFFPHETVELVCEPLLLIAVEGVPVGRSITYAVTLWSSELETYMNLPRGSIETEVGWPPDL